jgi:hypothetical protein
MWVFIYGRRIPCSSWICIAILNYGSTITVFNYAVVTFLASRRPCIVQHVQNVHQSPDAKNRRAKPLIVGCIRTLSVDRPSAIILDNFTTRKPNKWYASSSSILIQILRFRSRDGTARVEVDLNDDVVVIPIKVPRHAHSQSSPKYGRMRIQGPLAFHGNRRQRITRNIYSQP